MNLFACLRTFGERAGEKEISLVLLSYELDKWFTFGLKFVDTSSRIRYWPWHAKRTANVGLHASASE